MKRKIMMISLAVALVAIMALGASLAFFTDKKEVTNAFTVGNIAIELVEEKWVKDEDHVLLPGVKFDKDPVVKNVGANDAYVRLKVTIPETLYDAIVVYNSEHGINAINPEEHIFLGYNEDKWALWAGMKETVEIGGVEHKVLSGLDNGDTRTFIYYYTDILPAGEDSKTEPLFEQVALPEVFEAKHLAEIDDIDIVIEAEAVQVDGFDLEPLGYDRGEMYAAFDATFDAPTA